TVVRQIAFYEFERKVHTERKNGELTSDRLGEFWLEVQAESLGPAIKMRDGYETFWTYIPHFIHSPFYVSTATRRSGPTFRTSSIRPFTSTPTPSATAW